ncbi:MAG: hypothetical protein JSW47_16445 [Phycisphaerales bacterium]|nr:MAG: hypothetical protein JSW47_16445 [Phycisphaerales bacterium]UCF17147.1 MAG: hypothetical protein JSW59_06740 [Phycisphaerales bacterium]
MNTFIEENRRFLGIYYTAARVIGWLLLIAGSLLRIVALALGPPENLIRFRLRWELGGWRQFIGSFLFPGIVVLGLAQFVRYLCEHNYRPGWILRHGDKVLELYAASLVIWPIVDCLFRMTEYEDIGLQELLVGHLLAGLLPSLAYALIYVGMGQVLRRMLPMIEESKTLV